MQSYDDCYAQHVVERPERYNFARDVIDTFSQEDEKHAAMLWVDDSGNEIQRSFADISEASKRAANLLASAGVEPGETVILVLQANCLVGINNCLY